MLKRVALAAALLPLVYVLVMYAPSGWFCALIAGAAVLCHFEFLSMYAFKTPLKHVLSLTAALPVWLTFMYNEIPTIALVILFTWILWMRLFSGRGPQSALGDVSALWVGLFYTSVLPSYFIKLHAIGPQAVIYLAFVIWGADAFAYFTGKAAGRRRLAPLTSPNKTMEGAAGALAGGVLVSLLISSAFGLSLSTAKAAFIGLALAAAGIVGDLVESMFKRDAGVKDSGSLLPGHGGILDKLDGMLFSAPVFYYLLIFINRA